MAANTPKTIDQLPEYTGALAVGNMSIFRINGKDYKVDYQKLLPVNATLGTPLTGLAASATRADLLATDTVINAFKKVKKWYADFGDLAWLDALDALTKLNANSDVIRISTGESITAEDALINLETTSFPPKVATAINVKSDIIPAIVTSGTGNSFTGSVGGSKGVAMYGGADNAALYYADLNAYVSRVLEAYSGLTKLVSLNPAAPNNTNEVAFFYKALNDLSNATALHSVWKKYNDTTLASLDNNGKFTALEARFGSATDNATIEPSGHIQLNGEGTDWVDIDFPIIIRSTGANIPAIATLIGNLTAPQWEVNDYAVCEGQELIHGWAEGSPVTWHLHMYTGGTNTDLRFVKWEIEYAWTNFSSALTGTTVISTEVAIAPNLPAKTHLIFDIGTFTPTGGQIGAHVKARLRRIASAGAAPTADPFCEMLQLHVKVDSIGSRNISSK
jgi:hypothetical protein